MKETEFIQFDYIRKFLSAIEPYTRKRNVISDETKTGTEQKLYFNNRNNLSF